DLRRVFACSVTGGNLDERAAEIAQHWGSGAWGGVTDRRGTNHLALPRGRHPNGADAQGTRRPVRGQVLRTLGVERIPGRQTRSPKSVTSSLKETPKVDAYG